MTENPAAATPPLFYGKPTLLRFPEHRTFGVRPEGDFAFAAGATAIPLTVPEFAAAGRSMPIVFAQDAGALPLAVNGLTAGRNLFVTGTGGWQPGSYVPAYLRRYPFIAVEVEAGGPRMLGIDSDSALVRPEADEGERLFTSEGGPTPRAQAAMAMCEAYAAEHEATLAFSAALLAHRLLVPRSAELRLADGASAGPQASVSGFQIVDEAAFQALPGDVLAEFNRRGWLAAIVLHLASQWSWPAMLEAAERPRPSAAA